MVIPRRARLGQVFLADRRVEGRILEELRLLPDDVVLEIGAGPGNMTARLAGAAGYTIAVELDPRWAQALRQKFAGNARVRILEADILKVPIDRVVQEAGGHSIKVFGNLPYYITSPCLLHLFRFCAWITEITVMVQREVAERMVAGPGSRQYGLFSVTCQYYCRPQLLFRVSPGSFQNPPAVESALVRMRVAPQRAELGIVDEEDFWSWMRAAFSQKRKTLANNWKRLGGGERLRVAMQKGRIDAKARAESLSLRQLTALYLSLRRDSDV